MKTFWQRFKQVFIIFCVLVTFSVGFFTISHAAEIAKVIRVTGLIEGEFLGETSQETLFEGALGGMVNSLGDRYSTYFDQASTTSLMDDVSGTFSGIGVYVDANEENQVLVVAPVEGGPSAKAGIEPGDIIAQVDDVSIGDLSIDQVVLRMKGEVGTQVKITVMRGNEMKSYDITREMINETTVSGRILEEDSNIAYLRISKFALTTADEFVKELNKLMEKNYKGIMIDLRNNGGGEINASANIAQLFVPAGPIVHIVDKNGKTETLSSPGSQIQVPVVLLVNGHSASASEILAGAMKDTGAATLVGTTTFGKGLVQGVYILPDGTSLKLTKAKYLTPNKNDINKVGITPDVIIDFPADMTTETFVDVQLNKGIEVLRGQMK